MKKLLTLITLLLTVIANSAFAHQNKAAITKVLFNERTQQVEVMHRFYLHDAEHAMQSLFQKGADLYRSEEAQKAFSNYVVERFSVMSQGKVIPLDSVGHEIEGKFIWIYQETAALNKVSQLTIKHGALRELWDSQVNTINFEGRGKVKTLTFDGSEEMMTVTFDKHKHHHH